MSDLACLVHGQNEFYHNRKDPPGRIQGPFHPLEHPKPISCALRRGATDQSLSLRLIVGNRTDPQGVSTRSHHYASSAPFSFLYVEV